MEPFIKTWPVFLSPWFFFVRINNSLILLRTDYSFTINQTNNENADFVSVDLFQSFWNFSVVFIFPYCLSHPLMKYCFFENLNIYKVIFHPNLSPFMCAKKSFLKYDEIQARILVKFLLPFSKKCTNSQTQDLKVVCTLLSMFLLLHCFHSELYIPISLFK